MRKAKGYVPTEAGRRMLAAIRKLKRRGAEPSLGKLAVELDRSKHAVARVLDTLERHGLIQRTAFQPGVGRRIEVR
jgi:DNA-binding MarR family transcriptional regulator